MSRSYNHYLETERKLLLAAVLKNVPSYGWTEKAIIQGADDAGFDDDRYAFGRRYFICISS